MTVRQLLMTATFVGIPCLVVGLGWCRARIIERPTHSVWAAMRRPFGRQRGTNVIFVEGAVIEGVAGSAVQVIQCGEHERLDPTATLGTWFLHCPGQSPAWSDYLLSVIHLRPIEGVKPAVVRFPGATHEIMLLALDPSKNPTPTDAESWSFLRPFNLMEQVQLDDDDQARQLLNDSARAVVDGVLWAEPLLSGQVEPWRTTLIRTSAHLRGEEHAS